MGEKHPKIDLEREMENILKTNRRYFWDKGPLSPRQDKYIIIERVLEFGTEEDISYLVGFASAVVMAFRLCPVATILHVAPSSASVSAHVQEEKAATPVVCTLPHPG